MVTADGRVKITDFGIARATQRAGTQFVTATGMTVGTPAYMAPEQAMAGEVGPWTDLYSVGVLTYELVLGSRRSATPTRRWRSSCATSTSRIPSPIELEPTIDPGLSAVDRLAAGQGSAAARPARAGRLGVARGDHHPPARAALAPRGAAARRSADAVEAEPLTPAPFESHASIRTPTPQPTALPGAFITFDPGGRARPEPVDCRSPNSPEPEPPEPEPEPEPQPEPEPGARARSGAGSPSRSWSPSPNPSRSRASSRSREADGTRAGAGGGAPSRSSQPQAAPEPDAALTAAREPASASAPPRPWRASRRPPPSLLPPGWLHRRPASRSAPATPSLCPRPCRRAGSRSRTQARGAGDGCAPGGRSLALSSPVALVPRAGGGGALFVGTATATEANLLPKGFGATLVAPPQGTAVKIGVLDLSPLPEPPAPGSAPAPETVYALPTTRGTVIASCVAPSRKRDAVRLDVRARRRLAASEVRRGARADGESGLRARRWAAVIGRLNAARTERWPPARQPRSVRLTRRRGAPAGAARTTPRRRRPRGSPRPDRRRREPCPRRRAAQGRPPATPRSRSAAQHEDKRHYGAATTAISQADTALDAAFARLRQDGYSID